MAGAYVAKPAVSTARVEGVDVPLGWNVNWPRPGETDITWPGIDPDPFFPAPFPPGYSPDYSLAIFGSESIAYDGAASVTGTFRDHLTFATNEPSPIVWTATITSSPTRNVNLRFSGDEEYASSISSDCAFETYWGATPDIEFELDEEDTGGTVVLIGRSAVEGVVVGASIEIEVALIATITFTSNVEEHFTWGAVTEIEGQESGEDAYGMVGLGWPNPDVETEGEISVSSTSFTTTIQVDVFREEIYDVCICLLYTSPSPRD